RGGEVQRGASGLEAEIVGAEKTLQDLAPPRNPLEDLRRRKGYVEKEPDPGLGEPLPHHGRHELQLVVVHPDDVPFRGHVGDGVCEALVDGDVAPPPVAVELGRADGVVVERPDGAVAESVVVVLDLLLVEGDDEVVDAIDVQSARLAAGGTVPADPDASGLAEDRGQRGDQPAGARHPSAVVGIPPNWKPVGGYHQPRIGGTGGHGCSRVIRGLTLTRGRKKPEWRRSGEARERERGGEEPIRRSGRRVRLDTLGLYRCGGKPAPRCYQMIARR